MLQKHIDKLAKPLDAPADNVEANAAQATIPPKIDANDEMGRVNALYAMMENKASEEVRVSFLVRLFAFVKSMGKTTRTNRC